MTAKLVLAWLVFLSIVSTGLAASASTDRPFTGAHAMVTIDGVSWGFVRSWEGGDLRGIVASGGTNANGTREKHLASVLTAPLLLEFSLPGSAALQKWINDLCSNQSPTKTVTVTEYDYSMQ